MREIPLTKSMVALVDDENYDVISGYKWYSHRGTKSWYAWRNEKRGSRRFTVMMHRQILGLSDKNIHVDHRDLDGLNNQKTNLRIATKRQNASNISVRSDCVSGIKGVRFRVRGSYGKWEASITVNGKSIWLGAFSTAEEAAIVYAKAAEKYHGEFARHDVIL